ncbi:hypothetical protein JCM10207_007422 [Rhodosporidiobolus poonsookiae]
MTPRYRICCCTFNEHLSQGHKGDSSASLAAWLGPALSESEGTKAHDEAPEFVAAGFQELIPLHLSLSGLTSSTLSRYNTDLLAALHKRYPRQSASGYALVARHSLGGIALLVYARRDVAQRVKSVETAQAGCGVFGLMGNKGAVGARVTLVEPAPEATGKAEAGAGKDARQESTFTFVAAHLAAHQSQKWVERRNQDWRSIVERLVFVDERGEEAQLFDPGHLFFFGDLNYRLSRTSPRPLPLDILSTQLSALSTPSAHEAYATLLPHDQLTQERTTGRTLHHLREGPIAFPPSYKFRLGTSEYVSPEKRVPSWTDRVLFASSADADAKVERYDSVHSFERSDHKPVIALISLPADLAPKRLPFRAPFPIDPSWRLKRALGTVLDRLVGVVWCLVMLAGLGKDVRLGVVNLVLAALTAYYRRNYM